MAWSLNGVLPVPGMDEWFVCRAWSDSRLRRRCHLQRIAGLRVSQPERRDPRSLDKDGVSAALSALLSPHADSKSDDDSGTL